VFLEFLPTTHEARAYGVFRIFASATVVDLSCIQGHPRSISKQENLSIGIPLLSFQGRNYGWNYIPFEGSLRMKFENMKVMNHETKI
jgi:hypothetical protein